MRPDWSLPTALSGSALAEASLSPDSDAVRPTLDAARAALAATARGTGAAHPPAPGATDGEGGR